MTSLCNHWLELEGTIEERAGPTFETPPDGYFIHCTGLQRDVVTNSALIYEPKCGERGGVAEPQPMSTVVHRSPNKLWRSNSMTVSREKTWVY